MEQTCDTCFFCRDIIVGSSCFGRWPAREITSCIVGREGDRFPKPVPVSKSNTCHKWASKNEKFKIQKLLDGRGIWTPAEKWVPPYNPERSKYYD